MTIKQQQQQKQQNPANSGKGENLISKVNTLLDSNVQFSTKNHHPRILYLAKLSFRSEGEIKTFPEKQKLREFVTTRPALEEMLKGVLQGEIKRH